ncbi:MAG: OPT/YSL family transporter [Myxococcaceae bacterium]|nr:OPT/YSL family transporter [Myxococcaceae bacterium]
MRFSTKSAPIEPVPSPTGVALGMLIPALAVLPMLLGGLVQFIWQKVSPQTEDAYNVPLASGLIVGEALLGLVIPVLMMLGVIGSGGGGH